MQRITPLGLLYGLGVVHWLFFFFFVDYYTYSGTSPAAEIRQIIGKGSAVSETIEEIRNTYRLDRGDKRLLREFAVDRDVMRLFQYKYFTAHDWIKENATQDFIGESMRSRTVPYHVPNYPRMYGVGHERFLGSVLYTTSPQAILLYLVDSQVFTVLNLLFLYSVGFLGCVLLKKRYRLGFWPFALLFLLFNFNGYFVSKVTAYGPSQLGYFLIPFVIYGMFRIPEVGRSDVEEQRKLGVLLGLFTAAILFQGSTHLYVEMITFVIVWGIVNVRYWPVTLIALISSFSLGMARLLPAAVSYGVGPNPHALSVGSGYRHPQHIIDALVDLRTHLDEPIYGWWESSLFVSLVGLLLLAYFGMWAPFLRLEWTRFRGWKALALPCLIILIISFRRWKFFIIPNWIPLLNAESTTTRYMIIPLVIVTVIAAINLQGFIDKHWQWKRVRYLLISSIAGLALFLFNHSRLWRMHRVQSEVLGYNSWNENESVPRESLVNLRLFIDNNMNDTIYISACWIGLVGSVLSLCLVVGWLWWKPAKIDAAVI